MVNRTGGGGRPARRYSWQVKQFVVYTALRLLLFLASLGVVGGAWALMSGRDQVPALWTVVLAFVLSGVLSLFVLQRPREQFARRVEARASAAASKFEEIKAREDEPDEADRG